MPRQTAALCILVLCGCGAPTSTLPVHELNLPRGKIEFGQGSLDGQPGIDFGSIRYEGKRVIVWSDGREGHVVIGDGSVKGQIHSRRPEATECRYEFPATGRGSATIDGKRYRMADGNLFLVSLGESSIRVRQLDRDLHTVQLTLNGDNGSALKMAMRDDREFNQFFRDRAPETTEVK